MKTKYNIILTAFGLLVLLFISYKLAIQKTFAVIKEYNSVQLSLTSTKGIDHNLKELQLKKRKVDSMLKSKNQPLEFYQKKLLKFIQKYTVSNKNLVLVNFQEPHINIEKNNLSELNYIFTLKGSYLDIENLLHAIDLNYKNQCNSVSFTIEKELQHSSKKLFCTIILNRRRLSSL
ncbi:hypothetical protein [Zunongwangia sp.]|uniref:hypothetical protein n=1 Tax=Zunongwangia sp. TaxID=1965325 RepID=UPI003AA801A1